ncbi:MAG TPA: serine hydrolase [Caulobacteraceae bacterium]
MSLSRRRALGLAVSAGLVACRPPALKTEAKAGPIDTARLAREFPALAQRARPGAFALGVMNLSTTETWYWNTDRGFPLSGAAAAPIAAAAMAQVDLGQLRLDQPVTFDALDLSPQPSLIAHDFPTPPAGRQTTMTATNLISLALHEADSTAIDVLMKRVGGPGAVSAFLDQKDVTGLRVDRYRREIEVEMFGMPPFQPDWKEAVAFDAARDLVAPGQRQAAMERAIVDLRDTATVPAALGFLALLAGAQLVSAASTARLLGWMSNGPPGLFAAGLTGAVNVARASGAAPADLGFVTATTELAIVTVGGGRRYALAGFLVGSTATDAGRAGLFADAARLAMVAIG